MFNKTISKNWLFKHNNDYYVKLSKSNNFRSRAWYKINEIDKKYKIFKKKFNILEIGCYPGGWSQYILSKITEGKLICVDKKSILPINKSNVFFFKCDFNNINNIYKNILNILKNNKFDVIVSDICENLSGIRIIDMNNHIKLLNILLKTCKIFLIKNGSLVAKIFNGPEFKKILNNINKNFKINFIFKPISSYNNSQEQYVIAKYFL